MNLKMIIFYGLKLVKKGLNFDIVDISKDNWIVELRKDKYDLFLLKPPGISAKYKQIYDERLWIIKESFKTLYILLCQRFSYMKIKDF